MVRPSRLKGHLTSHGSNSASRANSSMRKLEELTYPEFEHAHRVAMMSTTMKADDILVRMAWALNDEDNSGDSIWLEVVDVSELPAEHKRLCWRIDTQQAAAIAALFITATDAFETAAYEIVGDLFNDVPNNLRPIP